jgi:hypothetical protein
MACRARAAAGQGVSDRCTQHGRTRAGELRLVHPARALARARVGRGPEPRHRVPLRRGQVRPAPGPRRRAAPARAGPDHGQGGPGDDCGQASNGDDSHRHVRHHGSRRHRARAEPVPAGWKRHGAIRQPRPGDFREAAPAPERRGARSVQGCGPHPCASVCGGPPPQRLRGGPGGRSKGAGITSPAVAPAGSRRHQQGFHGNPPGGLRRSSGDLRARHLAQPAADHRPGGPSAPARHVHAPDLRPRRRPHGLRRGRARGAAASRRLRRQDPSRRQARRLAHPAAHEVRSGGQPQNRQGDGADNPAGGARAELF